MKSKNTHVVIYTFYIVNSLISFPCTFSTVTTFTTTKSCIVYSGILSSERDIIGAIYTVRPKFTGLGVNIISSSVCPTYGWSKRRGRFAILILSQFKIRVSEGDGLWVPHSVWYFTPRTLRRVERKGFIFKEGNIKFFFNYNHRCPRL